MRSILLAALIIGIKGTLLAQSYDLLVGDKTPGRGKFAFGTMTRSSNGSISGTMVSYRHATNPAEGYGVITFSGKEGNPTFTVQGTSGGQKYTKKENVPLAKKTVVVYRSFFRNADGDPIEFAAVAK